MLFYHLSLLELIGFLAQLSLLAAILEYGEKIFKNNS